MKVFPLTSGYTLCPFLNLGNDSNSFQVGL